MSNEQKVDYCQVCNSKKKLEYVETVRRTLCDQCRAMLAMFPKEPK